MKYYARHRTTKSGLTYRYTYSTLKYIYFVHVLKIQILDLEINKYIFIESGKGGL